MKAPSLLVQKLWPRLSFFKSRSKVKVKVTKSKILVSTERSSHKEYTCVILKLYLILLKVLVKVKFTLDRRTDRQTDRQTGLFLYTPPPQTSFAGGIMTVKKYPWSCTKFALLGQI